MLKITIQTSPECWDDEKEEFVEPKSTTIQLEHSLVSLSKWEAKWNKPFLSKDIRTTEETLDYIRCMTITQNVDPSIYRMLTDEQIKEVNEYIEAPMTATWFSEREKRKGGKGAQKQVTNELIYSWMFSFNVPMECQKWHLNRLLTLLKVCELENKQPEQMGRKNVLKQNASVNAMRRKRLNTRG